MTDNKKIDEDFEEYLKSIGGLINGFSADKTPIYSRYYCSVGSGWIPLIQDLIKKLIELGWNKEICQVKEKFGGLRFYINDGSPEIFEAIREAENKSLKTCEECGFEGETRSVFGWYRTLCAKDRGILIAKKENENTR